MILSELCALSFLFAAPADTPAPVAAVASYGQPQDRRRSAQPAPTSPERSLTGGTPEPATMFLVAGAVLGYGALRRRNRKTTAVVQAQA